jgi:PPOX class probable F420-dependent enzyme
MSVIPNTEFGDRVRSRLRTETAVWLTTTSADGTPQPNPVWFLWEEDADAVLVYNRNDANRLAHVAVRPRVSLNFDGNGKGGNIVVLTGVAEQALDVPPPDQHEGYLAKYRPDIERVSGDPAAFANTYSVPLRIRITKVRGH